MPGVFQLLPVFAVDLVALILDILTGLDRGGPGFGCFKSPVQLLLRQDALGVSRPIELLFGVARLYRRRVGALIPCPFGCDVRAAVGTPGRTLGVCLPLCVVLVPAEIAWPGILDEGAIRADQEFLWRLDNRVSAMTQQWDKGWLRLQAEKRPRFQFNRAAVEPEPTPARQAPPPPDYEWTRYQADLQMLRLRPGHLYTEREVEVRYRRKMAGAAKRRMVDGQDRFKNLTQAKRRIIGWMRRTQGQTASRV